MINIPTFEEYLNESSIDININTYKDVLNFAEQIFDNGYNSIKIYPKHTKKVNSIFKSPKYSKYGKRISDTVYTFHDEDSFAEFVKEIAGVISVNDLSLFHG